MFLIIALYCHQSTRSEFHATCFLSMKRYSVGVDGQNNFFCPYTSHSLKHFFSFPVPPLPLILTTHCFMLTLTLFSRLFFPFWGNRRPSECMNHLPLHFTMCEINYLLLPNDWLDIPLSSPGQGSTENWINQILYIKACSFKMNLISERSLLWCIVTEH